MLAKLAARNVKRQVGNYLIYFITVSLTVALMFAINNVIFEKTMLTFMTDIKEFRIGLIVFSVIISLIVAFVLGYATSFMLKLRKREFGTYLTLGMTRKNVLCMFLLESLILCAVSLVTGLLLGLGLFQAIMAIVTNILGLEYVAAEYSLQGFLMTVGLTLAVFALSSVTSAIYLRRVDIYSLLHADKKSERKVRLPALWFATAAASLVVIIVSFLIFGNTMANSLTGGNISPFSALFSPIAIAVCIILFHIALSKSLFYMLLRSEKFKSKGANTFTLRTLSAKMSANSVMMGALAFLIAFSVIGANVSFAMQAFNKASLDRDYPFDATAEAEINNADAIPLDRAESIIADFVEIQSITSYTLYNSTDRAIYEQTPYKELSTYYPHDILISESDYDGLIGLRGSAPVDLKGGFAVAVDPGNIDDFAKYDFSQVVLRFGDLSLEFTGLIEMPMRFGQFFAAVVPDVAVNGLDAAYDCRAYMFKSGVKFDPAALRDALSYETRYSEMSDYVFLQTDFNIRAYAEQQLNAQSAVFIIAALYIAFTFVFMAMAILALKTLSDLEENKRRFDILFKIGASVAERRKALFRQTFAFFFVPFALPLLLSVPVGILCSNTMVTAGFAATGTAIASAGVALVITAVYALYFTATYLLAKRAVIG